MLNETVTIHGAGKRYIQVTWQRASNEPGAVDIATYDPTHTPSDEPAPLDVEAIFTLVGALDRARREALDPLPHPDGWVAGDGVAPLQLDQDEHVVQTGSTGSNGQWMCVRPDHTTHPCTIEGVDLDATTQPVRFAALVGQTTVLPPQPTD